MRTSPHRKAFTLIEMLVVLAIIAILATLLFAVMTGVKRKAMMTQDVSNLHQLGIAGAIYATDNDDKYPLDVTQLLSAGYGDPHVAASPSDMTIKGHANVLRARLSIDPPLMLLDEVKISYIGPGDGNWSWGSFKRKIAGQPNNGWLINPVYLELSNGKVSFPMPGRYQRLTMEGAVIHRNMSLLWMRMDDGVPAQGISFKWYFADFE